MKSIPAVLSLLFLATTVAFAAGETGNGRTMVVVQRNQSTGAVVSAEALDIYNARTLNQIEIPDVQTEDEAIAQAKVRLNEVDPDFLLYFSDALDYTTSVIPADTTPSSSLSTMLAGEGLSVLCNCTLEKPVKFDPQSGLMEAFPIYYDPNLSATSRAAIKIQGAIYLMTGMFLGSTDSNLASNLMVDLIAKENPVGEILKLTYQVYPATIRALVNLPVNEPVFQTIQY